MKKIISICFALFPCSFVFGYLSYSDLLLVLHSKQEQKLLDTVHTDDKEFLLKLLEFCGDLQDYKYFFRVTDSLLDFKKPFKPKKQKKMAHRDKLFPDLNRIYENLRQLESHQLNKIKNPRLRQAFKESYQTQEILTKLLFLGFFYYLDFYYLDQDFKVKPFQVKYRKLAINRVIKEFYSLINQKDLTDNAFQAHAHFNGKYPYWHLICDTLEEMLNATTNRSNETPNPSYIERVQTISKKSAELLIETKPQSRLFNLHY
jgi:hypothetical protein